MRTIQNVDCHGSPMAQASQHCLLTLQICRTGRTRLPWRHPGRRAQSLLHSASPFLTA